MNLNLSERDKKLLWILALLIVAAVPYLLLLQPLLTKCMTLTEEVSALEERKSYLQRIEASEDSYRIKAEEMTAEKEKLLARFPSELLQEERLLFIDNTEKKIPISLYQVTFGEDIADVQIAEAAQAVEEELDDVLDEEVKAGEMLAEEQEAMEEAGLFGVITATQFTYDAGYEEFKSFLKYISDYKERMVITELTASYTPEMDLVNGTFTLTQYALKGAERQPVTFLEPAMLQGSNNIFTRATGIFTDETQEEQDSDFFLMLSQPGADGETVIFGQTQDVSEETYLTSDNNRRQEAVINFTGKDGQYQASYQIDGQKLEGDGISFQAENGISFEVISSVRENQEDKVEVNLSIVNHTDVIVNAAVLNDDEENPRVTVKGKTGDIFMQ